MNNNTIHKLDFKRRLRKVITERFTIDTSLKTIDSINETADMTYNSTVL